MAFPWVFHLVPFRSGNPPPCMYIHAETEAPPFGRSISLAFEATSSRASTSAILASVTALMSSATLGLYFAASRFLSISWIAFSASNLRL
jgi:hypothetical protein